MGISPLSKILFSVYLLISIFAQCQCLADIPCFKLRGPARILCLLYFERDPVEEPLPTLSPYLPHFLERTTTSQPPIVPITEGTLAPVWVPDPETIAPSETEIPSWVKSVPRISKIPISRIPTAINRLGPQHPENSRGRFQKPEYPAELLPVNSGSVYNNYYYSSYPHYPYIYNPQSKPSQSYAESQPFSDSIAGIEGRKRSRRSVTFSRARAAYPKSGYMLAETPVFSALPNSAREVNKLVTKINIAAHKRRDLKTNEKVTSAEETLENTTSTSMTKSTVDPNVHLCYSCSGYSINGPVNANCSHAINETSDMKQLNDVGIHFTKCNHQCFTNVLRLDTHVTTFRGCRKPSDDDVIDVDSLREVGEYKCHRRLIMGALWWSCLCNEHMCNSQMPNV